MACHMTLPVSPEWCYDESWWAQTLLSVLSQGAASDIATRLPSAFEFYAAATAQQREVVDDFQRACSDERDPAVRQAGDQRHRDDGRQRSAGGPRNARDSGRRGSLGRIDSCDDERLTRR